jgi:hypothetical protein
MTIRAPHEGEETMFKRTLMSLTIALAIVLVVPTTALAMKVSDGSSFGNQSSAPLISEKTFGMYHNQVGPTGQELVALMARSDGLNQKYGLGQYALTPTVVSEKTAGLQQQPTQSEPTPVVSSDNEFNWGDAGIGAGAIFVGIIVAAGAALAVRHRHTPLAH